MGQSVCMPTLEDADAYLAAVENYIADVKLKLDSKQSVRLVSNHVWMQDYIEKAIINKLMPLKDSLVSFRSAHMGSFKSPTQLDAVLKLTDEITELLKDINHQYRIRSNYIDIKMKWGYSYPQMLEKVKSMRNRFNIIKSQMSKKGYEPESDW